MLIPRIVRGIPDLVYQIVRNTTAAGVTLVNGDMCLWSGSDVTPPTGLTRIPGVDVIQAASAISARVAGIIAGNSVVVGEYGLMQVYGYHSSVKTSAAALAVGSTCTTSATAGSVDAGNSTDDPSARVGICITVGASNRAGILIKCM